MYFLAKFSIRISLSLCFSILCYAQTNHSPFSASPDRRRHLDDHAAHYDARRRPAAGNYDVDLDGDYDRVASAVDDDWRQQQHVRPSANAHEALDTDRLLQDHHQHDGPDVEPTANGDDDAGAEEEEDERQADGGWASGRIRVAELRVRLPSGSADPHGGGSWVRVEKCQFQPANRTLDTRLTFPDLTISGRVQMQPSGRAADLDDWPTKASSSANNKEHMGSCMMILRLRQAGIEFRTVPLVDEQRSRTAAVRTDSYFADPGFISVFAHGCDGLMAAAAGVYARPNSKRRRYATTGHQSLQREQRGGGSGAKVRDALHFEGDILGYANGGGGFGGGGDWLEAAPPQDRSWSTDRRRRRPAVAAWQHVELANSAERDEQYTRDLEELFSKGVRGLLTTYMQRALQPAIKETLMENLGYRLSYG